MVSLGAGTLVTTKTSIWCLWVLVHWSPPKPAYGVFGYWYTGHHQNQHMVHWSQPKPAYSVFGYWYGGHHQKPAYRSFGAGLPKNQHSFGAGTLVTTKTSIWCLWVLVHWSPPQQAHGVFGYWYTGHYQNQHMVSLGAGTLVTTKTSIWCLWVQEHWSPPKPAYGVFGYWYTGHHQNQHMVSLGTGTLVTTKTSIWCLWVLVHWSPPKPAYGTLGPHQNQHIVGAGTLVTTKTSIWCLWVLVHWSPPKPAYGVFGYWYTGHHQNQHMVSLGAGTLVTTKTSTWCLWVLVHWSPPKPAHGVFGCWYGGQHQNQHIVSLGAGTLVTTKTSTWCLWVLVHWSPPKPAHGVFGYWYTGHHQNQHMVSLGTGTLVFGYWYTGHHQNQHMVSFGAVGWGVDQNIGGFGEEPGIKTQLINLIRSVRTVMRGPVLERRDPAQPAGSPCVDTPTKAGRGICVGGLMDSLWGALAVLCAVCVGLTVLYGLLCSVSGVNSAVLDSNRAGPASLSVLSSFILQSLRRTPGQLDTEHRGQELLHTLINCRYEAVSLRRYCSIVGYGWDYPDSSFRDVPLLYPQFLCSRLISMTTCSPRFRLSPRGLVSVRQTVRLLKPLDELKRGAFSLRVGVEEYRSVDGGVEVDLSLRLRACQQEEEEEGWSSIITLLSPNTASKHTPQPHKTDGCTGDSERCVRVAVPWWAGVRRGGPGLPLPLPSSLLGYGCPAALWAASRCLAETEKLKGADAVRAPLALTVCYRPPLHLPRTVSVRIRESPASVSSSDTNYTFNMEDDQTQTLILTGEIQRL
ncbi:hypothetical protein NFI96_005224 [Prochilodus magdalenae]|nr:hypothetical protein NFI96_005224 [Prochilodus magdalenae]